MDWFDKMLFITIAVAIVVISVLLLVTIQETNTKTIKCTEKQGVLIKDTCFKKDSIVSLDN